ncbi:hypothetical protein [Chryseobacterium sp.]|uniref:hypothetical protein n=1 Tax=Chryseobacterium sp. TaxID=1871047 RepID=UPI00289E1206|nr:hypothetical protein [Chryseobacterium sp.]
MKKILILTSSIASSILFSQEVILSRYDLLGGTFSNSISSNNGKIIKYEDILGTPYIDSSFREAKIADNYQNVLIRYNSFKDHIEFKNGNSGEIMILPKEDKFNKIEILSPKQILVLLSINSEPTGYYYEVVKGNISLYKKTKVNFNDIKPASSPYSSDQPASFSNPTKNYYIVNSDNRVVKNPRNQKDFIQQMPDKKEILTHYFKENKVKFDKEEDLKKLVQFLNQN